MILYNNISELILDAVNKYYTYEKDFNKKRSFRFPDNAWTNFKTGKTSLERMGSLKVSFMINDLFTPYEQMLITLAQREYYFSNIKTQFEFTDFFNDYKKKELEKWLKEQPDKIVGEITRNYDANGNQTPNYLRISIEDTNMEMNFVPKTIGKVPAGRQNRLEWIQNNLEKLK